MNFAQAVKNRDSIVQATIRTAFGRTQDLNDAQKDEMARIAREAFNAGVKQWEETYLESAVGPEEAARIRGIFHEPSPPQH